MIRILKKDGTWYELEDVERAVASFIYFDYVKDEEKNERLFINDKEFPAHKETWRLSSGYPMEAHYRIKEHIEYCIDTYKAFYESID